MTQLAEVIIPSFSSEVVESLPVYYRALAKHLAHTGRAIIKNSSDKARDA